VALLPLTKAPQRRDVKPQCLNVTSQRHDAKPQCLDVTLQCLDAKLQYQDVNLQCHDVKQFHHEGREVHEVLNIN
jgi:hypothetical protein